MKKKLTVSYYKIQAFLLQSTLILLGFFLFFSCHVNKNTRDINENVEDYSISLEKDSIMETKDSVGLIPIKPKIFEEQKTSAYGCQPVYDVKVKKPDNE